MMGLLDLIAGDDPRDGGLLGYGLTPAQQAAARKREFMNQGMDVAATLLGGSAPSPYPTSFGQIFGSALGNASMGAANRAGAAGREALTRQQYEINNAGLQEKKDKQEAQKRYAGFFTPPTMGQGVQTADASGMTGAPSQPAKFDLASIASQPGFYETAVAAGHDPLTLMSAMQKTEHREKLSKGDQLYVNGVRVAENPDTALKAPPTRTRMEGGLEIQEEYQPDGTWRQIGKGPRWQPPQTDPNSKLTGVSTLRKEFQGRPEVQNWQVVQPILGSMEDAATRNTRASDLNLVYGLGKIMDPNSVVREGELVMVKDTSSLPGWLVGEINRVNGGAALQPKTREAIMAEARSRGQYTFQQAQAVAKQYSGYAARNSLPPEDVVFGLSPPVGAQKKPDNPGSPQNLPAPPPGFTVVN